MHLSLEAQKLRLTKRNIWLCILSQESGDPKHLVYSGIEPSLTKVIKCV